MLSNFRAGGLWKEVGTFNIFGVVKKVMYKCINYKTTKQCGSYSNWTKNIGLVNVSALNILGLCYTAVLLTPK
jgi:hypothetical protein